MISRRDDEGIETLFRGGATKKSAIFKLAEGRVYIIQLLRFRRSCIFMHFTPQALNLNNIPSAKRALV